MTRHSSHKHFHLLLEKPQLAFFLIQFGIFSNRNIFKRKSDLWRKLLLGTVEGTYVYLLNIVTKVWIDQSCTEIQIFFKIIYFTKTTMGNSFFFLRCSVSKFENYSQISLQQNMITKISVHN